MVPPVPFPNTVVKRPSANDTAWATAWDNRPVPGPPLTPFFPICYSDRSGAVQLVARTVTGCGYAEYVDNRRVVGSVTIC